MVTGELRGRFRPEEKFLVHVPRGLLQRVDANVSDARAFVQNLLTFRGAEARARTDDNDIEAMPLWQSDLSAIGAVNAGDSSSS